MAEVWATLGTVATVAGVAIAGASAGAAAAGVGQPKQPDLASSSRELSNANAALLPLQRQIEAAAQAGQKVTLDLGSQDVTSQFIKIPRNVQLDKEGHPVYSKGSFDVVPYNPADWTTGGKYYGQALPGEVISKTTKGDHNYKTYDFTGYGKADVESSIANKNAANQLALSQKYDHQFIADALNQQKIADPESFAARAEMNKLIHDQINRPTNSPVSDMLSSQVGDSLQAAGDNRLTNLDQTRLDAAVAAARGDRGGGRGGNFAAPLITGFAGEARQQQANQGAQGFLAGSSSPEDIAYRREQQNLGNLSAEVQGKTPQSQFASMSGAQNGPTPMIQGNPLPVLPNNDQGAQSVALQNFNTQSSFANNQANPWMVGLSSLVNAGSVAGKAGWKPFGSG